MRRWRKFGLTAVALTICGVLAIAGATGAEPVAPQAIHVIDGDTIDVDGERYRLVGFDTPETYAPQCTFEKALGDEATRRLRELIASGELLELVVLPGRDRYDRGLARFYVGNVNVAEILISEGLARAYEGGRRQSWC